MYNINDDLTVEHVNTGVVTHVIEESAKIVNGSANFYRTKGFLERGSIVTVYESENGYSKISNKLDNWVSTSSLQ
jgi:hypothetical protein